MQALNPEDLNESHQLLGSRSNRLVLFEPFINILGTETGWIKVGPYTVWVKQEEWREWIQTADVVVSPKIEVSEDRKSLWFENRNFLLEFAWEVSQVTPCTEPFFCSNDKAYVQDFAVSFTNTEANDIVMYTVQCKWRYDEAVSRDVLPISFKLVGQRLVVGSSTILGIEGVSVGHNQEIAGVYIRLADQTLIEVRTLKEQEYIV